MSLCDVSEISFHKECLSFWGGHQLFCHISGGGGEGASKNIWWDWEGSEKFLWLKWKRTRPLPPPPPHKMKNHHLARLSYHRHGCCITMYCRIYPWYSDMEEMNCAFTDHAAQFFQVSRFTLFAALAKWYPWKIHCKNICRIYGRIHVAGNRLPGHATFFFTGTHKNYLALRKASYLRQRSGISCNNVNMSTHLYPLPRSRPNKSFYIQPTTPPPPPPP